MEEFLRKNARKTRGRPFEAGNPGRPKGAKNRVTRVVELLLEGEADALARKAIELAMAGDVTALRLCLDRISGPRKGRALDLELPTVRTPHDTLVATAAILTAIGRGEIDVHEAAALGGIVELQRRTIETVHLDERLRALEKQLEGR